MRTLDCSNLNLWLSAWKRVLKEPEDLLLGMGSFVNVVHAALGELERRYRASNDKMVKRSQVNWERRVLGLLQSSFEMAAPTVQLLRTEHGKAVNELERLLCAEPHYDVGRIYPLLEEIENSPSTPTIQEAMVEELLGEGNRLHLSVYARLLARRALGSWETKDLEDSPKKTLTRSYVSLLLESRVGDLDRDSAVDAEVRLVWRSVLCGATDSRASWAHEPDSLLDAFGDDGFWRRLAYRFLEDLGRSWVRVLNRSASEKGGTSGATPDEAVLVELGRETARGYAQTFLRRVLHLGRRSEEKISATVEGLGRRLHDDLAVAGVFAEEASRWGEAYEDVVARKAAAATIDASVQHLCEEMADRFAAEVPVPVLLEVGSRLEGMMAWGTDEGTLADREEVCAEVLARRDVQQELGRLLVPLSEELLARVTLVADGADGMRSLADEASVARFWKRWKKSFSREFGVFEYLPWENIGEGNLRRLLDELVEHLAGPTQEWRAVFRVGGIDLEGYPEGSVLRVGNVSLYDPGVYDFGEGRWWFLEKEASGPYVVARTKVEADGPVAAERAGRRALADALNVLTFAYSHPPRNIGGLKGEVLAGVYVYKTDGSQSQYRPRLRGSRAPVVVRARERDIGRFADAYRELLASGHDEGKPGEIRPGFLRAVHWYARGYWEPDPLQRFLTHWIGLEHLFVEGAGSKKALVDEVPKLTVSWRELRGMMFTGMTLRELVRAVQGVAPLKTAADACPDLEGWDDDARVLLDPAKVKLLALLASEHDSALAERLRRFVEELCELAQDHETVAQDVEWQREQESFKLVVLNSARNRIVHEARREQPDIEAYADKIERVLADVLVKLVADAVEEDPENGFVKQLAMRYDEQPWLEGRQGMPVTEEGIERLQRAKRAIMRSRYFNDDSTELVNRVRTERVGVSWS